MTIDEVIAEHASRGVILTITNTSTGVFQIRPTPQPRMLSITQHKEHGRPGARIEWQSCYGKGKNVAARMHRA